MKTQLPPHLSMVDDIADLLGISNDSAYRRIRGEKPMDLEEAAKLCAHYKISLDKFLNLKNDSFIFTGNINGITEKAFESWLNNLAQELQLINTFPKKHIHFLIKDIPPFYHFQIPELAAFKFYLWMKSILHYENFKGVKFNSQDLRYNEYVSASRKVIELYTKIPTTEIWNIESINSTLRQIEFYFQSGLFEDPQEAKTLYQKTADLVGHIERQAENGVKFMFGKEPHPSDPEYRLFVNELILGDNTFMVEVDNTRITYLNHSVLFYVGTRDEHFNKAMFINLENLMKKSTLISTVGEKERSRFFNRLQQKIKGRVESLKFKV